MRVRPDLNLQNTRVGRAGHDRIALLEAIRDTGSISAAAKNIGMGYRAAWDGVQILNNLFIRPLVETEAGGPSGGGARVTREGEQVITAYRAMEIELDRAMDRLQSELAGSSTVTPALPWTLLVRTSARNALRGTVARVVLGAVNAEVQLTITEDVRIVAIVTNESVRELGLVSGSSAVALISPNWIVLAREEDVGRSSARNRLSGTVSRRKDGAVSSEVIMSLGNEKTLTAIITKESAREIDFHVGDRVCALIKASHIILLADGQ